MGSALEIAATAVKAPGAVWVRPTTNAVGGEVIQLDPVTWNNNWITVQAEVDDVFIKFATSAAGAVPNSTNVSGVAAPMLPAAEGTLHIPAGTTKEFYLRDFVQLSGQGIFLGHISNAAAGFIRFYRSSGPRDL